MGKKDFFWCVMAFGVVILLFLGTLNVSEEAKIEPAHTGTTVSNAYAWLLPNGSGAAYMTIDRQPFVDGDQESLLSVSTRIAERAEIHAHVLENNTARMQALEELVIPDNTQIVLAPGGLHIMLFGVQGALQPGDSFEMTLNFHRAGKKTINVTVMPVGKRALPNQ